MASKKKGDVVYGVSLKHVLITYAGDGYLSLLCIINTIFDRVYKHPTVKCLQATQRYYTFKVKKVQTFL